MTTGSEAPPPRPWARRWPLLLVAPLLAVAGAVMVASRGRAAPDVPVATVGRGEFVDVLEVRGEIRAQRSILVTAPMQTGELQIVRLARNGTRVKPGDLLVEFDGTTLRRTIQDRQSEVRQADAEIEQVRAQARLVAEQNATALLKAEYDIERAKLDIAKRDLVSKIEHEQAKLALVDAVQRLAELRAKLAADEIAAEADLAARTRKREKALLDLRRAERELAALQLKAPVAGVVSILPNPRSGGSIGSETEFREGDRAWPGGAILELPDLSAVHLQARIDEADRGRLRVGQPATVRIEAVPGRDFSAKLARISVLARLEFGAGWPPPRNFEMDVFLEDGDQRIRPGMTAVARLATERLPDVLLMPSAALFQRNGLPTVYRLRGAQFEEQRVEVIRRGREQVAVADGLAEGDVIATVRPAPDMVRSGR